MKNGDQTLFDIITVLYRKNNRDTEKTISQFIDRISRVLGRPLDPANALIAGTMVLAVIGEIEGN